MTKEARMTKSKSRNRRTPATFLVRHLCFVILSTFVLRHSSLAAPAPASAPASSAPASQPVGKVVTFQPGVRIDYRRRQVELDARVTLRQGLLELFACSPRTREYESLICIQARPLVAYQALGLLGLTPGHPLRINDKGEEDLPDGQPVEMDVRYQADGRARTVPIESWMLRSDTNAPFERQPWVFAGSYPVENGAIAADEEGTIVALVDFSSAIIALPRLHTASNENLWLKPNTSAIPAVNTPCTLIVRAGPWRLRMDETGRLTLGGRPITLTDTARRLRQAVRDDPNTRVSLEIAPDCPALDRQALRDLLDGLGVHPVERPASRPSAVVAADSQPAGAGAANVTRWLTEQLTTQPAASMGNNANR
jgi:hypothetical protein